MIAACPKCEARYRVDEAKVGPDGARLRCARCSAVFRVRAPGLPAASSGRPPVVESTPSIASAPSARAPRQAPAAVVEPAVEYDRERLVVVADPKDDSGKGTASALASWGLQTILVHDGVEAMLAIQRSLPRVVVLDAALPKMYGFQVCEIVKRNESLRHIKVILVGAIHNRDRYRRPPTDLYGADVYLEQPDLPDGLLDAMVQFGLEVAADRSRPAPSKAPAAAAVVERAAPVRQPATQAARPVARPAPAPAPDDGLAAEREKADRLARIVVSDIVLYQGDKFGEAIRAGNLLAALDSEIEEGRNFFRQRINETVRNERDHLIDELMRVARERGMK
jgi:predicted Zn finger-like uncharacterized protein